MAEYPDEKACARFPFFGFQQPLELCHGFARPLAILRQLRNGWLQSAGGWAIEAGRHALSFKKTNCCS